MASPQADSDKGNSTIVLYTGQELPILTLDDATFGAIMFNISNFIDGWMRLQELGFEVRRVRQVRGLTQAELAKAARVSRTTLNQLENGVFPDLGVRKVQAILDQLGLTLAVQPARRPARPSFIQMACATAGVSFRAPLTEDELVGALLTGKVPPRKRPHLRALLNEASPVLLNGLIKEIGKWAKPGRVEKNLAKIASETGSKRG